MNDETKHDSFDRCLLCTPTTYMPTPGNGIGCLPCKNARAPGMSECEGCDPGKYKLPQNMTCIVCGPGKFTDDRDLPECKLCPLGYFGRELGEERQSCTGCRTGRYASTTASQSPGAANEVEGCTDCSKGRYNDQPALNYSSFDHGGDGKPCTPCPVGT